MELMPSQRRSLRRGVLIPAWLGIGGTALAFSIGISLPAPYGYLPLLASVIVLGLPHGAVDHLAIPRSRGERPSLQWIGVVVGVYLVLGLAYAGAWFLFPVASSVFFVVLTWLHWGQGDLWPLVSVLDADHLRAPSLRFATLLVRGGLPMLAPLGFFPHRYQAGLSEIVERFVGAPEILAVLFRPSTRLAVVGGLALLSLATLGVGGIVADNRRAWLLDVAEVLLLWWYFMVVPPVFAIGLYFTVWHSLRHVGRLSAIDPRGAEALAEGRLGGALWAFVRDATPLTALALLLFVGIYLVVPNPPANVPEFAATYLVFIAILTLPHVVVVTIMDLEAGLLGR